MEFQCLTLLFSFSVILMAAHAAIPPELYWERMLPNTPIPKAIRDLPKLGHEEIQVQDRFPFHYGVKKNELQDEEKAISSQYEFPLFYGVKKNELQDGVKEISSQDEFSFFYGVKKNEFQDGVKEILSQDDFIFFDSVKKNKLQDGVKDPQSNNEANVVLREVVPLANHHRDAHPKSSIIFSEEGFRPGKKLDVQFPKRKYLTPLLPREIAEHLPFSLEKINEILEILAVKPKSMNAKNVEKSLKICEDAKTNGEEKHCATSVESMVDFVTSKLGKNVHVTSTEVENESKSQKFTVKDGVKILAEEIIACHPMHYPYVVFYCHKLSNSNAHFMPLEGEDGTRVKAIAVCHKDTTQWDPKLMAFQVLKAKPSTIPLCHFFPEGHLLWYAK